MAKKKTTTKKAVKKKKAASKKAGKKTKKKKTAGKKVKKKKKQKRVQKKKKKTARKKTRRRLRRKSSLSKRELEYFRDLLIEKRNELLGDVNAMEAEALRKSRLDAAGDLSSMPIHMADIGTDTYEQEFSLGLMDSERKLLKEIHGALNRIDTGIYGICEGTGEEIPKARLEAIPWTRYCVKYAEMLDKGLVSEEDSLYESNFYDEESGHGYIMDEDDSEAEDDFDMSEYSYENEDEY